MRTATLTEADHSQSQPLLNWPDHWDKPFPSDPYREAEPGLRKLFRARLNVMLLVLANTLKHLGFDAAAELRNRIYNSRSGRSGAAIEAASLDDDALTEVFRTDGAWRIQNFNCVETDADIRLQGFVRFDYDENGVFLHVERQIAAFGAGLHRLDHALGNMM